MTVAFAHVDARLDTVDESGLILQAWSRPWAWRRVPRMVLDAGRFAWASCPGLTAISIGLGVVIAVSNVPLLLTLQTAIQRIGQGGAHLDPRALVALAVLGGLLLLRGLASEIDRQLRWHLEMGIFRHAQRTIQVAAAEAPLEAYEDPAFFKLLQRCFNSVGQVARSISEVVPAAGDLVGIAAISYALSLFATPLLLVLVVASALPAWLAELRSAREWYRVEVSNAGLSRLRYYLSNVFQGRAAAAEIRSYGVGATLLRRSDDAWAAMHASYASARARRGRRMAAANLAGACIVGAGVVLSLHGAAGGGRQVAAAVTGVVGLVQVRLQFAELFRKVSAVFDASLYLSDILDLRSRAEAVSELRSGGSTAPPPLQAVRAEAVSFRYPGAASAALRDVSISIPAGQLVALVGRNGSGKTTLAKIVAGLFAPRSGEVLWNGVPYSDLGRQVRRRITIQFQDTMQWAFSLRDNVWLGDVSQGREGPGIDAAARAAGLASLVAQLPHGLDTRLGKELGAGADLSGGEWQKVGLARCYFRESDLIILDEPTTSLDAEAEAGFLLSLRALLKGRSALIISHRFSNLKMADRIYVLDRGRVIESGTHDELVRLAGTYARLYEQQVENLV